MSGRCPARVKRVGDGIGVNSTALAFGLLRGDRALAQLIRFALVGGVSNIAYVLLFTVMHGTGPLIANTAGSILSTVIANELHRRLTFQAAGRVGWFAAQCEGGGLALIGLLVSSAVLAALRFSAPDLGDRAQAGAVLAVMAAVGGLRFIALRGFVFGAGQPRQHGDGPVSGRRAIVAAMINSSKKMPRICQRTTVLAMAAALLTGAAGVAAADGPDTGQDRPELRKAVQEVAEYSGITGVQVRVHDQRGEWVGSAGVRELGKAEKPPTDGKFRIGSTTKAFYSTVVLQLVGEGKIGLDSPAADYLPDFGLDRRITVRMLLQHTSGVFDYTGEYFPDGRYEPGIPWQGKDWVDNRFHTYPPEELARLGLAKPLKFAPGTNWSYSNTNYVLAKLMIEKVTGNSDRDEIQRRILQPLGLRDTVVPGDSPDIAEPHAHGYYKYEDAGQWKTIDVTRQNPSWISAAGDMISTTADLHTFFAALVGGKLLPPALLTEMTKMHPTPLPTMSYGLGLEMWDVGCGSVLASDGGVQGYGTMVYSTPDGSKTLEASVTYVDADQKHAPVEAQQKAMRRLTGAVFCDGQAAS